jgi:hypothetical protein
LTSPSSRTFVQASWLPGPANGCLSTFNRVAEHASEWLQERVPHAWFEQYSRRIEAWRLPGAKPKQAQVMHQLGQDGLRLRTEIWSAHAPAHLRHLSHVEGLRRT